MNIPVNKIAQDKKREQLSPNRPAIDFYGYQIFNTENRQKIVEQFYKYIGKGIISNEGEKKEIEEHVKSIQPEIFSYQGLIFSPGNYNFQQVEK
ncbi:hypothetical protein GCM10027429_29020 [Marivirga atlantica]